MTDSSYILFYAFIISVAILIINKIFKNQNLLISETGDRHQKFASLSKIPLTGGIFLFLSLLYYFNQNILSLILFSFFILTLGIFSDLKYIRSASKRFIFQTSIVACFVVHNDLQILNTKIFLLDQILSNHIFNYIFVSFCILIVINGSNFLDGLNTLNIGYYSIILLIIFILSKNEILYIYEFNIHYLLLIFIIIYLLNFFNKIYLGDSGSYLLGFLFSIFLIKIYSWNENISPFFIILMLWYPSFETLFSIIRKNIMNKSPMNPDANHLHQQIFIILKRKFKFETYNANLVSANLINLYNLAILAISANFVTNSQIQILLIMLNLCVYIFIYFKLFVIRYNRK